jgi:hypothetical protein
MCVGTVLFETIVSECVQIPEKLGLLRVGVPLGNLRAQSVSVGVVEYKVRHFG